MTDAELDAMLRTHAESQASAIEDDARVAATYRARSYVPALVAEVRKLNAEVRALHRQRLDDAVSVGALRGECGVLRAENERLSLALALQQELADGYKAGLYGDPEPRGMSDAGRNAYHAALNFRRWRGHADECRSREDGPETCDCGSDAAVEGR